MMHKFLFLFIFFIGFNSFAQQEKMEETTLQEMKISSKKPKKITIDYPEKALRFPFKELGESRVYLVDNLKLGTLLEIEFKMASYSKSDELAKNPVVFEVLLYESNNQKLGKKLNEKPILITLKHHNHSTYKFNIKVEYLNIFTDELFIGLALKSDLSETALVIEPLVTTNYDNLKIAYIKANEASNFVRSDSGYSNYIKIKTLTRDY